MPAAAEAAGVIEVRLRGGRRLRVGRGFDARLLSELVPLPLQHLTPLVLRGCRRPIHAAPVCRPSAPGERWGLDIAHRISA